MATTLRQSSAKPSKVRRRQPPDGLWRITVRLYHEMIRAGILTKDDPVELIDGWLYRKMPKNPPHTVASRRLKRCLDKLLPDNLVIINQDPITLSPLDSEPEPDFAVVSFESSNRLAGHPSAKETQLVIEVSDSSLKTDMGEKRSLYARAKIAVYWVVNLVNSQIEVFRQPTGTTKTADYKTHEIYTAKQRIPVVLNGKKVGSILVADVLP